MATAMQRPATGTRRVLLVGVLGTLLGAITGGVVGRAVSEAPRMPARVMTARVDAVPEGVQIEAVRAANYEFEAPVRRPDIEAVRVLNDTGNVRAPALDIEAVRARNFTGSDPRS